MKPSDANATILDPDDRYDPAMIVIEDNGMQQYVRNHAIQFSSSMMSKIVGIPTTGKKHSWENGIPRLRTLVENGGIHFYRGHDGTEDFVQAALSLELSDGKLSGHTLDLIAAWFMTEQGIRRLESMGMLDTNRDVDDEGEQQKRSDFALTVEPFSSHTCCPLGGQKLSKQRLNDIGRS